MSRIKCGYFTIRGRSFYVYEGVNTIGRDKQANVIVKDIGVSQQQALLIAVDEKHYISDFNSSNGTHINDEKLVPLKLYEIGDGSVVFFSVDVEATYRKISKIKPTDATIDMTMTQNTQEETLYAAKTQLFNEASFLTNVTEAAQSSQITQAGGSKTGDNSRIFAFPDDGLTFNSLNTQKLINQSEDINELPTQIVSTNNNTTSKPNSTIYDIPDDGLTFNSLNTQNLESEAIQDMPTQIIESVGDPSTIHNLPTQIVKKPPSKNDSSSNSNSAIHELPTQINKPAAGINNSGIHELPTQINKPAAGINNSGIHELPTQINKPDTSTSSKCLNEDVHEASTLILNNESEVSINDAETQLFPMLGIHDQPTQLTNIGDGSCSTAENSNRAVDLHEMETQLITQESSKISSSIDRDALELFMNLKENMNDTSKDAEQRSNAKNVNEDLNVEAGPSTRSRKSNLAVDQSICNDSHRVTRSRKQASNSVEGVNNAHLQKVDESLGNADLPNTGQSRVGNVDKTAVIPVEEEDTEVYDSDATQEYVNSNNDNDNLVEIASSSTNIQQSRASSSTAENNVKSKESFNEHFNTDSNSNDSEDFLANSSALDEIRNQDDADLQSQTRKLKRHIGSDDENVDSDTQSQLPMHLVNIRTKASRLNSDDEEMVDSDPQSQIPVHLLKKRTSGNRLDSDDLKIGKDERGDASGSDTEIEELGENDETNNGNDSDTDVEDLSKNDNSVQNDIARNNNSSTTRNNKDACNINPQIAEPIINISKTANNSGGKLFNVETANITESKANNSTLNATPSIIDCSDIDMDDSRTNMNESTDIEDSFVKRRSILADISSEFIPSTQDMANISTRNSFIAGQLSTIVDVTEHDCSDSFRLGLTQDDIALDESRTSSVDFAGARNETANFDFDAPTQKIAAQSNEDCFKKPLPNTSGISRSSKRKPEGDSFNESELFGADTLVTDDDDDELFVAATQQLDETNNRKKALNDSDIFREATQKCDQPAAKTRNSLKSAIFSAESEPFNDSDIFIAATQKLNETADLSSPKSISGNKNTSLRNANQLDNSTEMLFGADTQKLDNQDGLDDSLFAAATQKVTETARNLNTQDTVTVVDSHSFNFEKECLNRSVDSESRKRVSFGKVEDIHLPKLSTSGDISKSNASNSDGKNNSGVESQLEVMFDTENLHFDESAHENGSRPINPIGTTFEECTTQDVLNILDHTNNTGKDEAIQDIPGYKGTESTVNQNIVKKIEASVTPLRRTNRKLSKIIDDEQEEHGNKNDKTVPKNECVRTPLRRTNRKLSNVINDNEQEEINRKETKVKNVLKINENVNSECTRSPLRRTNRKLSKDAQVENSTDISKRDENETLDEYKLVSSGTPSKRTVRKSSRNISNDEQQQDKTAREENSVVEKSETKVASKIKNTRLSKLATIKINETEEDNSIMENLSIINLMKNETKKANLQTTNAASSSVAVEESSVKTDDASTSSSSVPEDTSRRRTTRVRKTILNSLVEETVEPVKKRAAKKAPPAVRNTRKRKSSTSDEEAAIKVSVPKYQKRMVLSEETINETALSATLVNVSVPAPVNKRGRKKNVTKVIFTMLDSPQLQKLVRTLGGVLADSIKDSTVLVTKSILRTVKLLSAVGYGIPICSPQWLEESSKANTFLDPWEYLLQDEEAEKKWGFSLKESFKRSRNKKLFEGYTFVLFSTYAPETIKGGIESCGGRCLTKPPKDGEFIIVAAEENRSKYSKYLKQNVKVVLPEAILDGVLRQEIHFDDHLLT